MQIAAGGGVTQTIGMLVGKIPNPYAVTAGLVLQLIGGAATVWALGARAVNKCVEIRYYYIVRTVYGLYYSGASNGCS